MKLKLSNYEKQILESMKNGEFVPVPDFEKRKKELQSYAKHTLEMLDKKQHPSQKNNTFSQRKINYLRLKP